MRFEWSDGYRAKIEKDADKRAKERAKLEATAKAARDKCWAGGVPWQPIEGCPFEAYRNEFGVEGRILVTDGESVSCASIRKRFGRPRFWEGKGEPEEVWRDGNLYIEGDGEFKEPDWPEWMFEWEFTDDDGLMNYAGGHETGKDEVGFVPTHWLPMPTTGPHASTQNK